MPLAMSSGTPKPADRVPRHGLLTHRIDIVAAEIARAADKGLLAHIGLDHTTGGGEMGVVCRFVTHPAPPAVESGGDVTRKRVATGRSCWPGSGRS